MTNHEVRGAVLRPFLENRVSIEVNFLIASGYTGQTTETIPRQPNPCPIECVVGATGLEVAASCVTGGAPRGERGARKLKRTASITSLSDTQLR